jgi:hypothetical protein
MEKTARYSWTDHKTNAEAVKEAKISPVLDQTQNTLVATHKQNAS